jgi:hypothetical protein
MTIAALKALCERIPWCAPAMLESALELVLEIAREGREGRRIGTLFTVGNADDVLGASRALILDPLAGHAPARTHISDPDLRGTIKELAQLDGAFVISEAGIVVAACRYLDASVEQIDLPLSFARIPSGVDSAEPLTPESLRGRTDLVGHPHDRGRVPWTPRRCAREHSAAAAIASAAACRAPSSSHRRSDVLGAVVPRLAALALRPRPRAPGDRHPLASRVAPPTLGAVLRTQSRWATTCRR